jgi:tRNA dimethylallyltransferase
MPSTKYLIVIAGPTAVGKTDVSICLAKELNTEIISADSRQFYREMRIGTAKPTAVEMQGVVHHFIDSHSIREEYNAGAFERDALRCLEGIFERKDTAVVVGGSGLYLKILTDGMDTIPDVRPGIREELMVQLEQKGLPDLLEQLQSLDPEYYAAVDRQNPQRVIRALEVCLSTGKSYSSFRKNTSVIRPFHMIKVVLERDREDLYDRINRRMDLMLEQGLLEEARALLPYRHHNALQTVGYSEVFDYLDGKYDEAEMIRLLKQNSRRYAKRQLTWFRRETGYRWFRADDYEGMLHYIKEQLE